MQEDMYNVVNTSPIRPSGPRPLHPSGFTTSNRTKLTTVGSPRDAHRLVSWGFGIGVVEEHAKTACSATEYYQPLAILSSFFSSIHQI